MLSNQSVESQFTMGTGLTKTSREIEAELKNPGSPLSQDLYNALMNALIRKKQRQRAEFQYAIQANQKRKLEEYEEKLAQEREQTRIQSRESLECYYEEQRKIANEHLELLRSGSFDVSYYASVQEKTRQLIAVQAQLQDLHREQTVLLQKRAENQQAYMDKFTAELDSDRAFVVKGKSVSFGISHLPEKDREAIRQETADALNRVAALPMDNRVARYGVDAGMSVSFDLLSQIVLVGTLRNRRSAVNAAAGHEETNVIQLVAGAVHQLSYLTDNFKNGHVAIERGLQSTDELIKENEQKEALLAAGILNPTASNALNNVRRVSR